MDDLSKYYQLLGLEVGAAPEQLKQAHRDMVKVWHPDRFAHDERLRLLAQEKLKEINGAYELLKAQAFEASIAPEPVADVVPPARKHIAVWATLGTLAIAAVAVFFLEKNHVKGTVVSNNISIATNNFSSDAPFALNFDGGQSYVALATTGALTGTFTVECWALSHKPREGGTIISSRAPNDFSFDIKFRQAKRFHADIGDGSRWLVKMANAKFSYDQDIWYHIAYVVTPNNYKIYVNGKLEETGGIDPAGNPMLYDANHHLCLGADGLDVYYLDGSIAEVRIWRLARSQKEIESNMNRVLTGHEPGLQGYWRFTEGSGTTTADNSGHGFDGTLIGNVSWSKDVPSLNQH